MIKNIFRLVLLSLLLTSCFAKKDIQGLVIKNQHFDIRVNDNVRNGVFTVPPSYDASKKYSLIFVLHGANSSGEKIQVATDFDSKAKEMDCILVYPNGRMQRWDSPVDFAFFDEMIKQFSLQYSIDSTRIYVTGHSAGAMEAYLLAQYRPGVFAAIAPVAGAVIDEVPTTSVLPTSVMHIHSKDDEDVPFKGIEEWKVLSAENSVEYWKNVNGLSGNSIVFFEDNGVQGSVWKGKDFDVASVFYTSTGHSWPPYATDLILDFFYNHPSQKVVLHVDSSSIPFINSLEKEITLKAKIEGEKNIVEKVQYFANTQKVGEATQFPWVIKWETKQSGVFAISARANLKDGSSIVSFMNPTVLVIESSLSSESDPCRIQVIQASSSPVEGSQYEARFAVDGNPLTRWSSEWKDNENIVLDIGSSQKVSSVVLLWERAYALSYAIDVSIDGKAWNTIYETEEGKGSMECCSIKPTETRYIKLRGIKRSTEYGYSLWECMVIGTK